MSVRFHRRDGPRRARGRPRAGATLGVAILLAVLAGCGSATTLPVALDTHGDTCAWCRMAISDARFAAQLVAPSEEPRLFDDIGCLRDSLAADGSGLKAGAAAFVADHRTRAWVPAGRAVYGQAADRVTPMGSGLAAWADEASRGLDGDDAAWIPRTAQDIFGPSGPPAGTR